MSGDSHRPTAAPATAISASEAGTLSGLFRLRVERSPEAGAYREYDPAKHRWCDYTWQTIAERVDRFRRALAHEGLKPGDRVAILLANGVDWVCLDLAAHASGLVVVGLYPHDTAASNAYIIGHSDAGLILLDTEARWRELRDHHAAFPLLQRVWVRDAEPTAGPRDTDPMVRHLSDLLSAEPVPMAAHSTSPNDLATLIYTSGTTGRPKGVMLSHAALLWNAEAVATIVPPRRDDVFLSILPLAHAFERTVGYYLPMMGGSTIAFARSVQDLQDDFVMVRPTVLLAVPRLFERMAEAIARAVEKNLIKRTVLRLAAAIGWRRFEAAQQKRVPDLIVRWLWPALQRFVAAPILAAFGGRLRIAVSGGAPLDPAVARQIIGLGVPVVEGYGLTEAAPVVAANSLEDNVPGSVGAPLPGVAFRLDKDGELFVRSPSLMSGYWKDETGSARVLDAEGWLASGDLAEVRSGRIIIRGRVKEMIVLSIGKKVNPNAIEAEIMQDPLFAQVAVIGNGRPFLVALAVLSGSAWKAYAGEAGLAPDRPNEPESTAGVLQRIAERLAALPRFVQVRAVHLTFEPWTIESGLLTPTLKIKRDLLQAKFAKEIEALYKAAAGRTHS